MVESSDSPEVQAFMAAFAKLRNLVDDTPDVIVKEARDSDPLRALCHAVFDAELALRTTERSRRELYASPTNPAFGKAWREYEAHWSVPVYEVLRPELPELDDVFDGDPPDSTKSLVVDAAAIDEFFRNNRKSPAREQRADGNSCKDAQAETRSHWRHWYEAASSTAADIEFFMNFTENYLDELPNDDRQLNKWRFDARNGIAAWRSLINEMGFDLAGVFRRRQLVPFVMIPRHVAKGHGEEPLSLLRQLRQAQEAFVYGVPFAAIALMRAILEALLREQYASAGNDLSELINAAKRLPVPHARLHRLRGLANLILHRDGDRYLDDLRFAKWSFSKDKLNDSESFETEIVQFLADLRTLIEQAPEKSARR